MAGFPKAAAWWRRAWWLGAIEATDAGRPPLDAKTTAAVCYLVESWQAGLSNVKGHRILNVYTNLESVRLEINGVATPHDPVTVGPYDAAQFKDVAYEDGNVQLKITKEFPPVMVGKTSLKERDEPSLADGIVQQIMKWETIILGILASMNDNVSSDHLRSIRRVLPITKTKMNWDAVAHRSVKTLKKTAPEARSKVKYNN